MFIGLLAASCATTAPAVMTRVRVDQVTVEVPNGWVRSDQSRDGLVTAIYAPEAKDNERKESITVMRTERVPAVAHDGLDTIRRLLTDAEAGLRDAKASSAIPTKTTSGLSGVSISVDFVQPELRRRYHREHAVFVDGSSLVHVIYTAEDPDPTVFPVITASLRHVEP